MYTILHISDLHRSPTDPITNDELLSALVADRDTFARATPSIPPPDAIIVSGDLVHGLPIGDAGYPCALQDQYDVALEFLERLTNAFLNGDRSRVVMVPGNHDVDWNAALAAMTPLDPPDGLARLLKTRDSLYRWDWRSRQFFQIIDLHAYEERLAHYRAAAERFYAAVGLRYGFNASKPFNLFDLDDGKILVAAFSSCAGNDCFRLAGDVPADAISKCHLQLRAAGVRPRLKIGVWHHSVAGGPLSEDFMDPAVVSLLIARGFRLGLHGHQHRADAAPHKIEVLGEERMAVVSAGSLCAGREELPIGTHRQYNVIAIDDSAKCATVFVREMTLPNTFTGGRLTALGGRSHVTVDWTPEPIAMLAPPPDLVSEHISEAEAHYASHDYTAAKQVLLSVSDELPTYGRQLLLRTLVHLESWPDIMRIVATPSSVEELVATVKASAMLGDVEMARTLLADAGSKLQVDPSTLRDLEKWLQAQRRMQS